MRGKARTSLMKWPFWTPLAQPDDCETIDPLLSLYADGMASAEEAKRVETHLPACADCRESLEWMQATQRILSARPVMSPPPGLRARIAEAIAASSDTPVQTAFNLRPARVFALRPALAAAASLSILGLVSYSLLHTPHSSSHLPTTSQTTVAIVPPVTTPPVTSKLQIKPRHHIVITRPAPMDMSRVAKIEPDTEITEPLLTVKTTGEPKKASRPTPTIAPILVHLPTVKKTVSPKLNPGLIAKVTPMVPAVIVKTTIPMPEVKKPDVVASVPHMPVQVTVAPTVIQQDTPPKMTASVGSESHSLNADLLGAVNAHVRQMQHAAYSTERKSIKGVVLVSHSMDANQTAYVPGVYTP